MVDLVRSYLRASNRRRLLVPAWIPGKSARAVRAGANLVAKQGVVAGPTGVRTWEELLVKRLDTGAAQVQRGAANST